jgi:hypothetical protein
MALSQEWNLTSFSSSEAGMLKKWKKMSTARRMRNTMNTKHET